jgi:carbon catabolite-derepressing protein kinase
MSASDPNQQPVDPLGTPTQSSVDLAPPPRRQIVSTIGILPSSLPAMHRAFMERHRAEKAAEVARIAQESGTQSPESAIQQEAQASVDQVTQKLQAAELAVQNTAPVDGAAQTDEQKAATSSHLKPHSRSVITLDSSDGKLKEMTSLNKKSRTTRWQFGIRSRNHPAEAIAALYKSLTTMGCEFEVLESDEIRRPQRGSKEHPPTLDEYEEDQQQWSDEEGDVDQHHSQPVERGRVRQRPQYGPHNDWGYEVAKDPWVINGRFKIDGLCPPGVNNAISAHSSRVDLSAVGEELARREKARGSDTDLHQTAVDNASYSGPASGSKDAATKTPETSLWVYFAIQLYQIEENFYLVDFKSSGYERIVPGLVREVKVNLGKGGWGWKPLASSELADPGVEVRVREVLKGTGRMEGEKKATSPFPFLDVASRLVAYLAEGRPA